MLEEAGDGLAGVIRGALDKVEIVVVACVVLGDVARPWEREAVNECGDVTVGDCSVAAATSWTAVVAMGSRYLFKIWNVGRGGTSFIQGSDGGWEVNRGRRAGEENTVVGCVIGDAPLDGEHEGGNRAEAGVVEP